MLIVDDVKSASLFAVDDTVSRAEHRHGRVQLVEAEAFLIAADAWFRCGHISDVVDVDLHRTRHVVVNLVAVMLLANEGEGIFMSIDQAELTQFMRSRTKFGVGRTFVRKRSLGVK